MSKPHRISALGNVELYSQSGTVNHASKATFGHDDNKHLTDLTNLRGNLNANDLLFYDSASDALAGVPKSDFALVADLSTYETVANVDTLAGRVTTLEGAGYQTASDVSNAISAIDYSAYETVSHASSTYETIANVDSLAGRVTTLEVAGYQTASDVSNAISAIDYSAYETVSHASSTYETIANVDTLAGRVSTLEGAGYQNATDVSNAVSSAISAIDYSAYATLSGSEQLTNKTLVSPTVSSVKTVSASDNTIYETNDVHNVTLTAGNNNVTLQTIALPDAYDSAAVCVKFSASGFGFCELKSFFTSDGTTVTLIDDSESLALYGSAVIASAIVLEISGTNVIVKAVKPSYSTSVKVALSCSVLKCKAM